MWRRSFVAFIATAFLFACGDSAEESADDARDLSLAPAESLATALNDRPQVEDQGQVEPQEQARRRRPEPRGERETRPPTPPPSPTLGAGTVIDLAAADTLTSRHNEQGEEVRAVVSSAIYGEDGREVIPAGAVFLGTISDIAPAGSPGGEGTMVLTFNRVQFGGDTYTVQARADTLGTFMKGRGITAGDAAKVGAGAVIGGIAGRVIGGNRTGTIVGAAAGAAAGAGIMVATRDVDIILARGALIRLVLTGPFELNPVAQ